MTIVYMDGVFDLFHYGHIRAINQCKTIGDRLANERGDTCTVMIGIISDSDTQSYKRLPVFTLKERAEILTNIKAVDIVISPAPLIVTKSFVEDNNIDLVVHAFADDVDFENQREQHRELIEMGVFERIGYTSEISTSDILRKIKENY